ncbi:MAG: hypothetical protein NZM12_12805, partial [Steroidobacteraceae bacterium]|nr:hypothetical protein [Steroidobacteraceae bacterium]
MFEAVHHVLELAQETLRCPMLQPPVGHRVSVGEMMDEKARHGRARENQVEIILRPRRQLLRTARISVVARYASTNDDAGAIGQATESVIQDFAANVVEQNINTVRAQLAQSAANFFAAVVNRGVESQFVDESAAFVSTARDADYPAARQTAQLTDNMPYGARRAGHDQRV